MLEKIRLGMEWSRVSGRQGGVKFATLAGAPDFLGQTYFVLVGWLSVFSVPLWPILLECLRHWG